MTGAGVSDDRNNTPVVALLLWSRGEVTTGKALQQLTGQGSLRKRLATVNLTEINEGDNYLSGEPGGGRNAIQGCCS